MRNPANAYRGSVAQRYIGPWMPPEVLGALPQLRRDYRREADPEREAMRQHFEKPEVRRRQESAAHESQRRAQASAQPSKPSQNERDHTEQDTGEQSSGERSEGRGSSMVGKDQPKPALRPPERLARGVDDSAFKTAWLAEQRDAALAAAESSASHSKQTQEHTPNSQPTYDEPSR
jgi:ribosomal protein S21